MKVPKIIHLKTSNPHYGGIINNIISTHSQFISACQKSLNLPKTQVAEKGLKLLAKGEFEKMAKEPTNHASMCPACLETLNKKKEAAGFVIAKYANYSITNPILHFTNQYKIKTIQGTVHRSTQGKITYTFITPIHHLTYADKYQFKKVGKEIVESDFNHPAIISLTVENSLGLFNILVKQTAEFRTKFLNKVEIFSNKRHKLCVKNDKRTDEEWLNKFNVKYIFAPDKYNNNKIGLKIVEGKDNWENYVSMKKIKDETNFIATKTLENYIAEKLKEANNHFDNCIVRLADRLTQKGISDNTDLKIEHTEFDMADNLSMRITSGSIALNAYSIWADGPINEPHFRFLVK